MLSLLIVLFYMFFLHNKQTFDDKADLLQSRGILTRTIAWSFAYYSSFCQIKDTFLTKYSSVIHNLLQLFQLIRYYFMR